MTVKKTIKVVAAAAAFALGTSVWAGNAAAELKQQTFNVVGTWGNLANFKQHEGPFWSSVVPKASGGKITAKIQPITEVGLKGFEVTRLLRLGVYDMAFGVLMYPFPSQLLWCNAKIEKIEDLKGKKIRVYSATLGDFVEGVGGTSVTIAFAEVVPALQKKVADCGITGTTPAYRAKWHEVATHAYAMRVGWGISFGAFNLKRWNSLDAGTKAFLTKEFKALEDRMWKATGEEDAMGLSCNTGGKCTIGKPGNMKLVKPSKADLAKRTKVLEDYVLKRWAERCTKKRKGCVADWNKTIGKIVNIQIKQ
jgi:TRAP-type mannitol/chloroaromatic compound transport system substrate-binding protein